MLQTSYFLGANSPSGFYSLYDELTDPKQTTALYILKGGPGCGKSTLMKRVARHAEAADLDTQLILCSGDPDSLDAVLLPQKGIAVVDGTAPHVVEARCPGAVETYVDLSRFYDRVALQPVKSELISTTAEYKERYRQAYRCLKAAGELYSNLTDCAFSQVLQLRLQKRSNGILGREIKKGTGQRAAVHRRFLSAITCQGTRFLWNTVSEQADRVYELVDRFGSAHHLLTPIIAAACSAGIRTVACHDPMSPTRLSHLILPELSLAFVTSTPDHPWPHKAYRRLRLDSMAEEELNRISRPKLRFTRKICESLTEDGISNLRLAKEAHDRLEQLYNPHVDFERVINLADRLSEAIIDQTLQPVPHHI